MQLNFDARLSVFLARLLDSFCMLAERRNFVELKSWNFFSTIEGLRSAKLVKNFVHLYAKSKVRIQYEN